MTNNNISCISSTIIPIIINIMPRYGAARMKNKIFKKKKDEESTKRNLTI